MMDVIYVCGFGRSGSTTLGRVLAIDHEGLALGELASFARSVDTAGARCSCGDLYEGCDYWGSVDETMRRLSADDSALTLRPMGWIEGWGGLLLPKSILRKLVRTRAYAANYPAVSFADGMRALREAAGCAVIDTSKTARRTGNRPRLIEAAGLEVALYLAWRPFGPVLQSYRSARRRRDAGSGLVRSVISVAVGRTGANLAARWSSVSMGTSLHKVSLTETLNRTAEIHDQPNVDHLISGNRIRHRRLGIE